MLTGELRGKIDALWNAFYLLFIRGLDNAQTLAENKANRTVDASTKRSSIFALSAQRQAAADPTAAAFFCKTVEIGAIPPRHRNVS